MFRSLFCVSFLVSLGCQQQSAPTPSTPSNDKTDIHIRTPRLNVDVQGKGSGKGTDVDVQRKNP